jgi:FMN-dependent NADH-azoreductase
MPTLLHLNASPRGEHSLSRQLTAAAVQAWKAKNPGGRVIERDLTRTALTFVDLDWIVGAYTTPEQQTEVHKKALALSDELIAEVLEADEILIGTPMYNFAPPAVLKAWIDHIVRAGKTFRYTADGVEGLAKGRKVVIATASGGKYDEASGMAAIDHETPYLRFIFGFIGITDVTFVNAGGTSRVMQGKVAPKEFLAPFAQQIEAAV